MVYIVTIDAVIGAGKSSLISQLKDDFTCFQEPVEEWSLLQNFYEDMPKFATPFQFQVLFSFHKLYSTFKNMKDKVILERCPWSSKNIFTNLLVESGHITPQEYQLYCNFYDKVAFPINLYIFLKVDTEVAYRRILNRDRAAERSLANPKGFEYFEVLNAKYNESIKKLDNVQIIDANRPLNEIKYDVMELLQKLN